MVGRSAVHGLQKRGQGWPDTPETCRAGVESVLRMLLQAKNNRKHQWYWEEIRGCLDRIDWAYLAKVNLDNEWLRLESAVATMVRRKRGLSLRELAPTGIFAKNAFGAATDDDQAAELLMQTMAFFTAGQPMEPAERHIYLWAARWAQSGFPIVRLTREQATNFMVSDPPKDALDDLRAPWRAFGIMVDGALEVETTLGMLDGTVSTLPMRQVAVQQLRSPAGNLAEGGRPFDGLWNVRMDIGLGHLWQTSRLASELDNLDRCSNDWSMETIPPETKAMQLCCKLALNTVIAATGGDARKIERKRKKKRRRQRPGRLDYKNVETDTYVLGTPVTIDATQYVRDYMTSKGSQGPRKVRWWVRGFWRDQRYGQGRKNIKRVFIEAHERGRKSGPMVVRDHQLKE